MCPKIRSTWKCDVKYFTTRSQILLFSRLLFLLFVVVTVTKRRTVTSYRSHFSCGVVSFYGVASKPSFQTKPHNSQFAIALCLDFVNALKKQQNDISIKKPTAFFGLQPFVHLVKYEYHQSEH